MSRASFTVLCAADINREKVNLEVCLPSSPAHIGELFEQLEDILSAEAAVLCPALYQKTRFQISHLLYFDEKMIQAQSQGHPWKPLRSISEVGPYDQLYASQPTALTGYREAVQDIPAPRKPSTMTGRALVQTTTDAFPLRTTALTTSSFQTTSSLSAPLSTPYTSPTKMRLQENTEEEQLLFAKLSHLQREREELELRAALEDEANRQRFAQATSASLAEKENQLWQQRQALLQAEAEYKRLLEEKTLLMAPHSSEVA